MDGLVSRFFRSNSGTSPVRNWYFSGEAGDSTSPRDLPHRRCVGLVGYDAPFTDVLPRSTAAPTFIFAAFALSTGGRLFGVFLEFARRALQRRWGAKKELLRKRHNQLDQRNIRNEVAYRDRIGALFRQTEFRTGDVPEFEWKDRETSARLRFERNEELGPHPRCLSVSSLPPPSSSSIYNTCYTTTTTTFPPS